MKVSLQVNQAWPDVADVYNIGYSGARIGRVWLDRSASELPWEWLLSLPMNLPETSKGRAASRNEALNALATEWVKLIQATPKNRLERVLAFARDLDAPPARKPVMDVELDNDAPDTPRADAVPPPLAAAPPAAKPGAAIAASGDISTPASTATGATAQTPPPLPNAAAANHLPAWLARDSQKPDSNATMPAPAEQKPNILRGIVDVLSRHT